MPLMGEEEVKAVADVLHSRWLTQGEKVAEFETAFARYIGAKEAIAVFNGTVALHLTMIVAGIGPGDEVIIPSFTFISTINMVLFQNATPVFAEIDPKTFNILPEDIESKITDKTRAVVPVHYGGQVADMDSIMKIGRERSLIVIEDAAEAHGARYEGKHAGTFGDMAIFSFHATKNITTGEGGIIVTNNSDSAERLRLLRNHGMDAPYHHIMLGYNYRMAEMQAALGLVQLKRLDQIISRKSELARYYDLALNTPGIITPYVAPYTTQHGYMLYTIKVPPGKQAHLIRKLGEKGIEARIYFPPAHLQPYHRSRFAFQEGLLPITEEVAKQVVSLPIFPSMSDDDAETVVAEIKNQI